MCRAKRQVLSASYGFGREPRVSLATAAQGFLHSGTSGRVPGHGYGYWGPEGR